MIKVITKLSVADMTLVLLLLVLSILSGIQYWKRNKNERVLVYKDNVQIGDYDLNTDRIIAIDEHNSITIQNGRVAMLRADCPDKRCVKQGFSHNLPIICLPNHLVIEIKENDKNNKFILY